MGGQLNRNLGRGHKSLIGWVLEETSVKMLLIYFCLTFLLFLLKGYCWFFWFSREKILRKSSWEGIIIRILEVLIFF